MREILVTISVTALWFCAIEASAQTVELIVSPAKMGNVQYRIDGASVRSTNLLSTLGKKKQDGGEIKIYMNELISFASFKNIKGIVGKAGYLNDRYFVLGSDGEKMVEVKLNGPAIPFDAK